MARTPFFFVLSLLWPRASLHPLIGDSSSLNHDLLFGNDGERATDLEGHTPTSGVVGALLPPQLVGRGSPNPGSDDEDDLEAGGCTQSTEPGPSAAGPSSASEKLRTELRAKYRSMATMKPLAIDTSPDTINVLVWPEGGDYGIDWPRLVGHAAMLLPAKGCQHHAPADEGRIVDIYMLAAWRKLKALRKPAHVPFALPVPDSVLLRAPHSSRRRSGSFGSNVVLASSQSTLLMPLFESRQN